MFGRKCDLGASMTLGSSLGYLKEGKKKKQKMRVKERTESEGERRDWSSVGLVKGDAIVFDLPVGGVGYFFRGWRTNSNCYTDLLHFFLLQLWEREREMRDMRFEKGKMREREGIWVLKQRTWNVGAMACVCCHLGCSWAGSRHIQAQPNFKASRVEAFRVLAPPFNQLH